MYVRGRDVFPMGLFRAGKVAWEPSSSFLLTECTEVGLGECWRMAMIAESFPNCSWK